MNTCCNTQNTARETAAASCQKRSDITYRPDMDVLDTGPSYEVRMDVPGASRDSIEVTLHEGVLTVEAGVAKRVPEGVTPLHAEYGVNDFRRHVRVGEDIDAGALSASFDAGVLTLTLPKRAEVGPRRIEISAS